MLEPVWVYMSLRWTSDKAGPRAYAPYSWRDVRDTMDFVERTN